MYRQRQEQQQVDPRMVMAQQLGIFDDPNEDLMGLVQLLSELERPDQVNRELEMRQSAQDIQGQQFAQSQELAKRGMQRQEDVDAQLASQWLEEMATKEELAKQEREMQLKQFDELRKQHKSSVIMGLLGLSGTNMMGQPEANPAMFNQVAQPYGLPALVPQSLPGFGGSQLSLPSKLTPDQQLKLKTRQEMGL